MGKSKQIELATPINMMIKGDYVNNRYLIELRGNRSIREISRKTGISHTYLTSLEKGLDPRTNNKRKPSFETLRKLAEFYNINIIIFLINLEIISKEEIKEFTSQYNL